MAAKPWKEDRKLVKMVLNNHSPTEFMPEVARNDANREPQIICGFCYNDWPCKSVKVAEAADAALPPEPVTPKSTPKEGTPDPTNPGNILRRTSFQG